jgi:hypothetical protein
MLTIQNHYRLVEQPIGKDGWSVCFSSEQKDSYEIKLEHEHLSSVKVYLQRELEATWDGRLAYYFKNKDKSSTGVCVTADYLRDMNNLLKTLERFTC